MFPTPAASRTPGFADDALAALHRFARKAPLPRVRALHLPPRPPDDRLRGEFCALELDDGAVDLCDALLDDT